MILQKDITGYQVGDQEFLRGVTAEDSRGTTQPAQAYNLAWLHAQETGNEIVPLGEDKVWDFKAKAYVLPADLTPEPEPSDG